MDGPAAFAQDPGHIRAPRVSRRKIALPGRPAIGAASRHKRGGALRRFLRTGAAARPAASAHAADRVHVLMRALLLSAGRGERMRPLTDTLAKPLLTVAGRRLIEWQINALVRAGITELVINTAHL